MTMMMYVWVLEHRVQFSYQMSTRCPIGHESENLGSSRSRDHNLDYGIEME